MKQSRAETPGVSAMVQVSMSAAVHKMQIEEITEPLYPQIIRIDADCFERAVERTGGNIDALCKTGPGGCIAAMLGDEVAGYLFSHTFGNVGYLGPLAVAKKHQGNGFGKALVEEGITLLRRKNCEVIGLEVKPEKGRNIDLYLHRGFVPAFATIMYAKTGVLRGGENPNIRSGTQARLSPPRMEAFLSDISPGLSFAGDIEWMIRNSPENFFFYETGGEVRGMIAFDSRLHPFVWGAVRNDGESRTVSGELLRTIENRLAGTTVRIRANARYTRFPGFLLEQGYRVERGFLRMVLKGYEGTYLGVDGQSLKFRAWMS